MGATSIHWVPDEEAMRALGAELVRDLDIGDSVLLIGPLGAGKTTLVRGMLAALGVEDPVRSPTFNLLQVFDCEPPIVHADLYRVENEKGLGLEDYLLSHLAIVEWAERLAGSIEPTRSYRIRIDFEGEGRMVTVERPD